LAPFAQAPALHRSMGFARSVFRSQPTRSPACSADAPTRGTLLSVHAVVLTAILYLWVERPCADLRRRLTD